MKSSVVVLAVLSALASCQAEETAAQKLTAATEKCKTEIQGGDEIMKQGTTTLPQTEAQQCFLECVYKRLQLIVDDKFSENGAKNMMMLKYEKTPDQLKMAQMQVDACLKEVKTTPGKKCSLAYNIRDCFLKQGQKHNFFIKA